MPETNDLLYPAILRAALSTPWAIQPEKLGIIAEVLAIRSTGRRFTADEIQARIGAAQSRQLDTVNGVAVIPVMGTIAQRMGMMSDVSGGTSTEGISQALAQAMADDSISAVVFDVDSPGGVVNGVPELADEIMGYRNQKPMVAVSNGLMASAAYWLMSQAHEVVVTPSGEAGSIGVFAMHQDLSRAYDSLGVTNNLIAAGKFKTEGNPYEPLGEDARDAIQARVDDYYGMFTAAVARGRGTTAAAVTSGYGEGRVLGAKDAVKAGVADRVETLRNTIARLQSGPARARVMKADSAFADEPPTASDVVESVGEHELWLLSQS